MKKKILGLFVIVVLLSAATIAYASGGSFTDFEPSGFVAGESVHNHKPDGTEASPEISFHDNCVQAWFVPRAITDEEVVDITLSDPDHGKVWRFSNGTDDGVQGQAPHSANSGDVHGETGAANDAGCGAVTTANYYAEFEFKSATGSSQVGYRMSINANSGDTRHAYTRIRDDGGGFDIEFFDTVDGCTFDLTTLDLDLSYNEWHTLGIEVFFEDGLASGTAGSAGAEGNDVVNVYIDNALVHTGTTWESCVGARSVDRILFDHPETNASFLGGGLYIDDVLVTDLCPTGNCLSDQEGPVTINTAADPNPVSVNGSVTVTALVDDSATGGSNIASADYSLDGDPWTPMTAADGAFDEVSEEVTASVAAPAVAAIYDLCVRGTDAAGNIGDPECIMLVVYDPDGGFVTGGGWIDSSSNQLEPIYNTIPDTIPGSFPSLGYEATSTDEAGDHIAFAHDGGQLQSVEVSLTDWACENDFDYVSGSWVPNRDGYSGEACLTTPGSGFSHPITLNIYEVDNSGSEPAVGPLITAKTETFFIPFRPSWDAQNCTASGQTPDTNKPFGGKWYDPVLGQCVNGYAFTLEYDFSSDGIILPDEVIYGVAYNTAHHGGSPLGVNGPYNSLNLSLSASSPSVGTDVEGDTIFWDTSYGPFYCDSGAGGTDTFRRDAGCWDPYAPVVKFNKLIEGAFKADPTLGGKASFGFVSKYKKGASIPEGNTEFQFKAGDLNFHSTSYEWLVVTGSDYAKFKGSGTINGTGDYKFMLWAGDKDPDTFRIKIWYEDGGNEIVVYDNGMDQAIGGGNIVVHTK